ncbi:Rho termination factor N-terminal domain-containing protein [filamentous cyanobacterium LEGE 11480]|uniref:Rho termination factor N-terminal domain-containing protein n=1 Tax=Romeriopsis navalis LEGE 11480 TaxID=2777977 RepID=A0A928VQX4_9CYAN|nr:Rho termination factor N-terminal domain-containing protein [Romeriopsis navalis]MBE9030474.1 Rho termination factor N-terminal domain-containing protein [Romeriopsis navalis LEGE 11480]
MFSLINTIDTILTPIEGIDQASQIIRPYLQAAWQVMTAEKTQRILRAVRMASLVLGTIILVGLIQVGRLAWQEATIAFREQLDPIGVKCPEPQEVDWRETVADLVEPDVITSQMGVRELRKLATQQGIRNAGRMRKQNLLMVLNLTGEAIALER